MARSFRFAVGGGVVLLVVAACGTDNAAGAGRGGPIRVAATDSTCSVAATTATAGNLTFEIANNGSKVTEFYLYAEGDRIMGEVENIAPGLQRRLIVNVAEAGRYQTACKPGMVGRGIRGGFTVTGGAPKQTDVTAEKNQATSSYATYVANNTAALEAETAKFVDAVQARRFAEAKERYAPTRVFYERIEPVAEKFGDLDPAVDAREADLAAGQQFTGFHRLEKDLWVTGPQPDSGRIADTLRTDVKTLVGRIRTLKLSALDLANGAKSLLDEVATKKVKGEEEIYSHTDLWDFQANVDGSKSAIAALRPILQRRDPSVLPTLDKQFANVQTLLDGTRAGDRFRYYNQLSPGQIRSFAAAIDALGEPLSTVSQSAAQ